jgi:23S rRNA (cytidine1920-2'-O)/16S rRNA (cytidine1409-2'-O)-methyltransferase
MVLEQVTAGAGRAGLATLALTRSPITGAEGNVEFLAHFARQAAPPTAELIDGLFGT